MIVVCPRPDRFAIGFVLLSVLVAVGCFGCRPATPPAHPVGARGRWYVVAPGETLSEIARKAGVPEQDLLEVNGLRQASEVIPGRRIFVLDVPTAATAPPTVADESPPVVASGQAPRFRWPVDDPRVTSPFGKRWGRVHEGIDLTAPIGTPVLAAAAGEVVYSGNVVSGYGNMVVLKHGGDLMTVYAHNSVLMVKVGHRVDAGQRIALSGQSGHATGPHLHFEVRSGQVPRNPLPYLPEIPGPSLARERSPKS